MKQLEWFINQTVLNSQHSATYEVQPRSWTQGNREQIQWVAEWRAWTWDYPFIQTQRPWPLLLPPDALKAYSSRKVLRSIKRSLQAQTPCWMPTENNGPSNGNKMFIIKAPFRWRVFKKLRADSELILSNPWSQVRKVGFHSVLYGCRKGRGGKLGSLQFCLS